MNVKDYMITIDDKKYCKDTIRNKVLRVNEVENVNSRPSNPQDFTLYILNNGAIFYYGSSMFMQVELEKQKIKPNKSKKEKQKEVIVEDVEITEENKDETVE